MENKCSYIILKSGLRCKRNKVKNSEFCSQHKKINEMKENKKDEEINEMKENNLNKSQASQREEGSEACTICLDSKTYPLITLSCKHTFHEKCLMSWIKQNINCPICRQTIITYTIQKSKKSKPLLKDFKKELYDKYYPHLMGLTDIFNIINNTISNERKREKVNILYGFVKAINEYLLGDGKHIIYYLPQNKEINNKMLLNFIDLCSDVCPEYVAELTELNQKVLAL